MLGSTDGAFVDFLLAGFDDAVGDFADHFLEHHADMVATKGLMTEEECDASSSPSVPALLNAPSTSEISFHVARPLFP